MTAAIDMGALGVYVLIVSCVLGAMLVGLLIAGLTHQANGDVPCPEWVAATDPMGLVSWTPCPHRRPCPLHDRNGVKRHA